MRCCDCEFRKKCDYKQNDIITFEYCSLVNLYARRYAIVSPPPTMTRCECETVKMNGQCGIDCPAFDIRICEVT
jgi:hypothetical protein